MKNFIFRCFFSFLISLISGTASAMESNNPLTPNVKETISELAITHSLNRFKKFMLNETKYMLLPDAQRQSISTQTSKIFQIANLPADIYLKCHTFLAVLVNIEKNEEIRSSFERLLQKETTTALSDLQITSVSPH